MLHRRDGRIRAVQLFEPLKALKAAGAAVEIAAPKSGKIRGMQHHDKGESVAIDPVPARARSPRRKPRARAAPAPARKYWSHAVMEKSDALDLERRAFTWKDPKRIARSLKRSAERSTRRKSSPYRSAMSMLTFYINRGGRNLSPERKRILNQAKIELRRIFGRG